MSNDGGSNRIILQVDRSGDPDGGEADDGAVNKTRFAQWLEHARLKHDKSWTNMPREESSQRFFDYLVAAGPKMVFVLTPLFALLLMLFFRRPKRFYLEHLVFSLHFHSFLFLLLLVGLALPIASPPLALWGLVYLVLALRRVYDATVLQLLWKLPLALLLYLVAFTVVVIAVVIVGFIIA